jgi:alanyl-tRNA synthetase
VDKPLAAGATVRGAVDWVRRFDHMQQHTGQHVLSAAYDRLFGVRTESFHLGATSATIDLAREVSPQEIRAAEDEANRVVWQDRRVSIRFASAQEAASLPLRKESIRTGPLRLIEIDDFDLSACGGTHVSRTGAIGIVATAGWEKFRGGTRIEFLCGERALTRFRLWREALGATTRHLSVQPSDLAAAVEKLQGEVKALQKTTRSQQEALAAHEARALVARATATGRGLTLVEALDGWDATGLKALATSATAEAPTLAVALFGRADPAIVVIAAGSRSGTDASAVLKALTATSGGRGGGKRELAQGGGFTSGLDDVMAEARRLLSG